MKICDFEGCERGATARGLCQTHYMQQRSGKELTPIRAYGDGGKWKNPSKVKAEHRRKRKEEIVAWKGGACEICGGVFGAECYDLHHPDPSVKEFHPSRLLSGSGIEKLKELTRDLMLVCANCHRTLHHGNKVLDH